MAVVPRRRSLSTYQKNHAYSMRRANWLETVVQRSLTCLPPTMTFLFMCHPSYSPQACVSVACVEGHEAVALGRFSHTLKHRETERIMITVEPTDTVGPLKMDTLNRGCTVNIIHIKDSFQCTNNELFPVVVIPWDPLRRGQPPSTMGCPSTSII